MRHETNNLTFEEFLETDSAKISLSKAGKDYLQYLVEELSNFEWVGDDEQLNSLAFTDAGFDSEGYMHLELRSNETKDGNPFPYSLDFEEHYICTLA